MVLSNFFHRVVKTTFYFSKRLLWGKLMFLKIKFVYHFRTMSGKFSTIWQKFLHRNLKTAFYVPIGALREEHFFWKTYVFFLLGHWEKIFRLFVDNFSRGCQNFVVHVHGEDFWGNHFFWKFFIYTMFSDNEWNISGLL